MSNDSYPLRPDDTWYSSMRAHYGSAVPDIEHLRIRRGLQNAVADMYAQLSDLDLLPLVAIRSITTRNAGFVVINTDYKPGIFQDDRIALDLCFERHKAAMRAACEHCGRPGSIIAKSGLEALLDDPSTALGDRLLCAECYQDWSTHD
ncbi:hypothetical protein ACTJK5_10545 [Agrobacterium sp. 22094]|uniref:hypothetical protein n=1 Tax=Agrobacterium sp. 22094 TaxID=3453872 RepID=UPI003F877524